MPTMQPKHVSDPYAGRDPLVLARDVAKNLQAWARPEYPARPEGLPDNVRLGDIVARQHEGRGVLGEDRAVLQLFGAWRYALQAAETEAASRLLVLLGCIRRVDETDPTLQKALLFRRFIRASYGRWPPRYVGHAEVERIAFAIATDLKVLPAYLRLGSRPPEHLRSAARAEERYRNMTEKDAYDD